MTPTTAEADEVRDVFDRALKLPPDVRARLAQDLWDSVIGEPPNSDADREYWKAEIARRIEAVRDGTMKTYTLEETMEYLQRVVDEGQPP